MGLCRRRRVALVIAALIGVPLGLALVVMGLAVAVALSGMSIDASRWRDAAAERASAALGRPVILQGAFELEPRLGRELGLRVGSVRILNPPGFAGTEFLAIGELRARIDLFDALRGRLRSSSIEAREVGLWLERGADGRGNWTSTPRRDARRAAARDRPRSHRAARAGHPLPRRALGNAPLRQAGRVVRQRRTRPASAPGRARPTGAGPRLFARPSKAGRCGCCSTMPRPGRSPSTPGLAAHGCTPAARSTRASARRASRSKPMPRIWRRSSGSWARRCRPSATRPCTAWSALRRTPCV